MSTTSINRRDLSNDALQGINGIQRTEKARSSWFHMEGQIVVHTSTRQDFGSSWNRWMDRIGAERGCAEDLQGL